METALPLFIPQVAKQAGHALFDAGQQIAEPRPLLRQHPPGILVHQQAGQGFQCLVVQLCKGDRQPGAGVIRAGMGVQRHLQYPVHQGTALVGAQLCLAAGAQPQHILQKIAVAAAIIFFHLAGRDPQPPPKQRLQRRQIFQLTGCRAGHTIQHRQAGRSALALQRLGQAGLLHMVQHPPAAQAVQGRRWGGSQIQQFQIRRSGSQRFHDGLHRRTQCHILAFGPAHP